MTWFFLSVYFLGFYFFYIESWNNSVVINTFWLNFEKMHSFSYKMMKSKVVIGRMDGCQFHFEFNLSCFIAENECLQCHILTIHTTRPNSHFQFQSRDRLSILWKKSSQPCLVSSQHMDASGIRSSRFVTCLWYRTHTDSFIFKIVVRDLYWQCSVILILGHLHFED